jgi:hypothetical protein
VRAGAQLVGSSHSSEEGCRLGRQHVRQDGRRGARQVVEHDGGASGVMVGAPSHRRLAIIMGSR